MASVTATEHGNWAAHAHIEKFHARSERDAMHELFPVRARLIDAAKNRGHKCPKFLVPHISGAQLIALGADPFEIVDEPGNLLVNAGINRLGALLVASGGTQAYDSTHTAIGAGDTNTAAAASQTDLAAAVNSANRWVQVVDSAPTFSSQVLTCIATFATGNGNFAWAEWAIGQNTSSAAAAITSPMLNRKVASLGTKTSSAAWAFSTTVTIS